jgi:hypothetical protein
MEPLFRFLEANPSILLFLVVGMAVGMGRVTIKGVPPGTTAEPVSSMFNPAVLMDGVAGARSHSGPAREAAKDIDSPVPWIGFPVGYAVSGVLLTVFGYVAMIPS